jgi:hypothetical protein
VPAEEQHGPAEHWGHLEHVPTFSPRVIASILFIGGLLTELFRHWLASLGGHRGPPPFGPPEIGLIVVALWLIRAIGALRVIHMSSWWISIVWHALFTSATFWSLPFALALADHKSIYFLWPHFWLASALFLSIVGLRAERQLRLADRALSHLGT